MPLQLKAAADRRPAAAVEPRRIEMTQKIIVRDIRLAADIGVYAHEIGRLQALTVHVALQVLAQKSDRLADTIDYNVIVAHASALATQRIDLIETFAQRLALACLDHPPVLEVEVQVEKPGALANGMASAQVVMKAL
ncbi:dihydroneopterin aldolase [Rhizorhapis suberifaciens]|uniref:dihydroneopterin aldolase n=1 Tax=Rhizorhapis suberifaciens TaxID=13656 RepID=A0A840HVF9_9SPHN|nr:dihydroneopterin aldolase [Rhizorhapis suberifaciens]MBB4641671.1 dihydroneopterin aldolase [Rhizorhapis suberifaciens]